MSTTDGTAVDRAIRRGAGWRRLLLPGDPRRADAAWPVPVLALVAVGLALLLFGVVSAVLVLVGGPVVAVLLALACVALILRTAHAGLDLYAVPLALGTILAFDFFYLKPLRTFRLRDYENWGALALYLVVIVLVCAVSARTRRRLGSLDRAQVALSDELAALRRIARLSTADASPAEVFATTAEEVGRLGAVDAVRVLEYGPDGTATVVAAWGDPGLLDVGERLPLDGDSVTRRVLRTGERARLDRYVAPRGAMAERVTSGGISAAVGFPVYLGGRLWGVLAVGSRHGTPVSDAFEKRLADLTDLVAMVFSSARDRAALMASRTRIVVAVDETRRRLERDLHDGIQQRLVSLALDVRRAQSRVPAELTEVHGELAAIGRNLSEAVDELRELARGIHPAILETGGLRAALRSLARRSAVPVVLEVDLDRSLPASVEVAAYYLVSEALTNATKHARATEVHVRVAHDGEELGVAVSDDGVGGADPRRGSGLVGMEDRVHALGGRMDVTSAPGAGTTLEFSLPTA
ncbi:histidine kinase [Cellulosimicrobium sp. I38E]|uniref:sensor histidine kinase n=1 Tax=Cellulosimicrobium sp. I38E TaxID=1393139 RepID=UPI0012E95801|nr:histidine kinase [Cellulosimicrobium sp. I38E]